MAPWYHHTRDQYRTFRSLSTGLSVASVPDFPWHVCRRVPGSDVDPAGQAVHFPAPTRPTVAEYVPAGRATHSHYIYLLGFVPGHRTQETEPSSVLYEPAGHASSSDKLSVICRMRMFPSSATSAYKPFGVTASPEGAEYAAESGVPSAWLLTPLRGRISDVSTGLQVAQNREMLLLLC
eukprot:3287809-Rhodomonas_salina.5